MPKMHLSVEQKVFIVQRLAHFERPQSVASAFKENWPDHKWIQRQNIEAYDPTKRAGRGLSPRFRALFVLTRQSYLNFLGNIPLAQTTYRLQCLQRWVDRLEDEGQIRLAARLLRQAAKESTGWYLNPHHRRSNRSPAFAKQIDDALHRAKLKKRSMKRREKTRAAKQSRHTVTC